MSDESNICVAVRVRPFNAREISRHSKLCIEMEPRRRQATITPPESEPTKRPKTFTFDYVYWSHDGSKIAECKSQRLESAQKFGYECDNEDDDRHSNKDVYNDLGKKILENAWKGYNASIFAYGQTGSGKSYSMVGYGEDLGIIPLICDELFVRIGAQSNADDPDSLKFKVAVSMIEIYNEQVQDLFAPRRGRPPGGLRVREHPKFGPYVEGAKEFPVATYTEINDLMERGSRSRTVASTQMNQTSSRAHTLFTITLTITEVMREQQKAVDRVSKITLVDLAGSERANATGATGDRLKEGCAINQSLSALGNVISALVKKGNARGRRARGIFIPYRTSTLTWLLRESLGGNARTIMVAALSPASINYEETLSTLKYADRAKQIKNKAVVNEDPNVRMIKELKAELDQLRQKLAMTDTKEVERLQEELAASVALISQLQKSDAEAQQEMSNFKRTDDEDIDRLGIGLDSVSVDVPHLKNLHPDPLMNGRLVFVLRDEETIVGKNMKSNADAKIRLGGASIKMKHCKLVYGDGGQLSIVPMDPDAKTYLNGVLVEEQQPLHHFARLIFGNMTFLLLIPSEQQEMGAARLEELSNEIDYVYAQTEFAEKQGLSSIMDEDEQEKQIQQKIKEEMARLEEKKRQEEERLDEQRQELLEKQRQLEEEFQRAQEKAGAGAEFERAKAQFEEHQRLQKEDLDRQKRALEERRHRLEEESKKQEDLQRKIREKEDRDRKRRRVLERKLLELIPMVYEANDYAIELDRPRSFAPKLVNFVEEDETGAPSYKTDIIVESINAESGKRSIWDYEKFESRFYQMQPLYQEFMYRKDQDASHSWDMSEELDPFWDPDIEEPVLVGISMIYLKCLSHLIDMRIWTPVITSKGERRGELSCGVIPCSRDGTLLLDDYIPNPKQLIGKPLSFKIVIEAARGLPEQQCTDSFVRYSLRVPSLSGDRVGEVIQTNQVSRTTRFPSYAFEQQYDLPEVTPELIDYLRISAIKFEVFARRASEVAEAPSKSRPDQLFGLVKALVGEGDPSRFMKRSRSQRSSSPSAAGASPARDSARKVVVRVDKRGRIRLPPPEKPGNVEPGECSVM